MNDKNGDAKHGFAFEFDAVCETSVDTSKIDYDWLAEQIWKTKGTITIHEYYKTKHKEIKDQLNKLKKLGITDIDFIASGLCEMMMLSVLHEHEFILEACDVFDFDPLELIKERKKHKIKFKEKFVEKARKKWKTKNQPASSTNSSPG